MQALELMLPVGGYERTSIAAIAEKANMVPGLVHYHFTNKQEILLELVRDLGERLERRWRDATRRAGRDPRKQLEAWLDSHVALGKGADLAAVACWVSISVEAVRQPEVREVYAVAIQRELDQLQVLLEPLVQAPQARLRSMAAGLLAAIQGSYMVGTAAASLVPRGFARPALRAMLDGFLAACHE